MPQSHVGDEDAEEEKSRAVEGADAAGTAAESVASGSGSHCDVGCDSCDGPDCGCDVLLFVRLSTVLLLSLRCCRPWAATRSWRRRSAATSAG